MNVLVIDYGMGNLASVRRAFEEVGGRVVVSDQPSTLKEVSNIVLPGVGSFADGMANLNRGGWVTALRDAVLDKHLPLLGICLGMQLLAEHGAEGGETDGLGFIPGRVERLVPDSPTTRIPHVGWNEVYQKCPNLLLDGIPDGTDFYFVHSFRLFPDDRTTVIGITPYCGEFPSVVMKGSVFGTQFHPEKSQPVGFRVLRNFLQNIL